ncbi:MULTISPECIES: hypothetical protein [Thermodesulfobacterium]|jgi:hypothetical protein|uniref:Cytochrome c domain-containing protein n=2 Tax=Thermodesulfobacterium commune TaxID=1741 RepID=A0A075WSQ7_9BACT|nr:MULTISPECIES: hypothetical protein [Thermodesulfobacterium]KUJ98341.1 MAG: Uncharacterized protein XD42_0038 [Thermodesulfobacterium sp. 37_54]KUK19932.1 MAG: Uncharacterized protein XD55_0038 [Thermodesulfobacterium commune]AIH03901.1 hypothetical protein HL41_03385 [Thermodesulfobacterium commune DSM 2178]KUK37700.1 MAG: Uncharacterized protein XD67_1007 [Thermodesulfobacterium commune]MBZ4681772.1 hypothetical protein [Thermodesulfobacterium sp.]
MKVRFYDISILPVIFLGSLLVAYSYHKLELAAEDFKCLKCHKGSRSLPNIVKEKNIKTAEELRFYIRKGPKSGLHVTVPEEDLEKAIQYLNLK